MNRFSLAAQHLLFAFLIQNTIIIDEVTRRQFDFSFTTLENLAEHTRSNLVLTEYLEEIEYYRTAYFLSSALYVDGRTIPSLQLWTFLARNANAGEWGARARISSVPVVERAAVIENN
jgi:hypothetical protein